MKRSTLNSLAITAALAIGLIDTSGFAQSPDNTKANKGDQSKSAVTADQAKNAPNDRQIMADIRKAVMADKSLSTYGHNVKIISQHGKVTLKGPVNTEDERKSIKDKAVEVAGADNVTDNITVKGSK
jgi:hyperosmotically inducible periplasmic protein